MDYYIVNAFTGGKFSGNPAAVCIQTEYISEAVMQNIAAEFGFSETAYVIRQDNSFGLRWFTPTIEVDQCGHATLASAHILWQKGYVPESENIEFETKSGMIFVWVREGLVNMEFPMEETWDCKVPGELSSGLSINPVRVQRNRFDYLAELESEVQVKKLNPDMEKFSKLDSRGVIVTAASDSKEFDFISRFFAPQSGIPEDPVTGSAHCALAPYWYKKTGKEKLTGFQASGRGGIVVTELRDEKVILSGAAKTVSEGRI